MSVRSPSVEATQPNSRAWWDARFAGDWVSSGGREQSTGFMELLLRYLPASVASDLVAGVPGEPPLTVLDCGCALGDGTAVLAAALGPERVRGCDFSEVAVIEARRAHPGIAFERAEVETLALEADVIVLSHCFEHLHDPMAALRRLVARARRYVLVLVPYLEPLPLHPEHVRVVHAATLPTILEGWQMTHRVLLPPSPGWNGEQLLAVYAPADPGTPQRLEPLPDAAELAHRRRLEAVHAEAAAAVQNEIANLRGAIDGMGPEMASLRETLAVVTADRETSAQEARTAQALAASLAADRAALAEDLRTAKALAARLTEDHATLAQALAEAHVEAETARREREALDRELARQAGAGGEFVLAIQAERGATVGELNRRIAELEGAHGRSVNELESWKWEATTARRELARMQGSRFWRFATVYWALRRRLTDLLRRTPAAALPDTAGSASDASVHAAAASGGATLRRRRRPDWMPPGVRETPHGALDVVVLSIIDWDFRFQRPQQLARQLGRAGHRVFYLSTTRFLPAGSPPWEMAWKGDGVVELAVRSRPLDVYGGALESGDLDSLEEVFSELLETLALADTVLVVQVPFWTPLAERLRERFDWRIVYDCMDEWTNFPGFGGPVLAQEARLVAGADVTLASARRLHARLEGRARRLALVPNGVDGSHYASRFRPSEILGEVRRPVLGYFGALASWVDVPLLERVARAFPEATLVLAGGAFDVDLSRVEALPNVRLLGQRPYEEMPPLLWQFDVCLIPFLVNDITEATNPVKLYEYLWGGKPVVAPRLTELEPYADACYLADDHEGFLRNIATALAEPADAPVRERRRAIARENDWRARRDAFVSELTATYPLVSVVIVTYGGLPLTRRCLDSLLRDETWPRLEVIVVDNASPDGTAAWLAEQRDPRLRVLPQARNLGFAGGNNVGIAAARGEVIVLLNNDTVVPPGLLGRLVHAVADPGIGLACPTTNFCGNEARVEVDYEDLADMPAFAAARVREHTGRTLDLRVAPMYCVALRRDVLERVGPLDEQFGIGMFEDDDYSQRVRAVGLRVVCAEDAFVHHVGQGAFQALPAAEYQALWDRNQALYERKWGRWVPHVTRDGVAAPTSKVGG